MRVEIRECDDWVAVYKDGRKVWENHSCNLKDGLSALGIEFKHVDLYDCIGVAGCLTRDTPVGPAGAEPFPETLP